MVEKNIDLSKFNESLKTIQNTIHTLETQVTELITSSSLIQDMNSRLKSVESQIKANSDTEKRLKAVEAKTCTCTPQEVIFNIDRKLKEVEMSSNRTQQHVSSFANKLQEIELQTSNRSQILEDKIKLMENSSANKEFVNYLKQENSELKIQNSALKKQNDMLLLEKSSRNENPISLQENKEVSSMEDTYPKGDKSVPTTDLNVHENTYSKGDKSVPTTDLNVHENTRDEVVYLKTSNRFDVLNESGPTNNSSSLMNKSSSKDTLNRSNANNTRYSAEKSESNKKSKLNIIIDSQGNLLDGTKMYKNMEVEISVLGPGQKNIKGARSHISQQYYTHDDHVIVAVGSNDLTNRHPDWCINEMEYLIKDLRLQIPESNIHILPAFERLNNDPFNLDASAYNEKLKLLCAKYSIKHIQNNSINTTNSQFFREDDIHLNMKGCIALVRLIKTHINSCLNLKPYEQYKFPGKQRQTQNRRSSGPAKQSGQSNLLENFLKLLLKNN